MTKKEALEASIKHWQEMYEYMEKNRREHVSARRMRRDIGQDHTSTHCPLCKLYLKSEESFSCKGCPLDEGHFYASCCNEWRAFYLALFVSFCWLEQLPYAMAVIDRLKRELAKVNEEQQ